MHDDHPPVRHLWGFPPEAGAASDDRVRMPWPQVALIVEKPDGIFLERYLSDGTLVGDTWHEEIEHAKEQASEEYGPLLGPWIEIPEQVSDDDVIAYVLSP